MKKLALLFLAVIALSFASLAQGISFDELARLRSGSFPSFETYAHNNGYKMDHLDYDYPCATFRKKGNMLSYCRKLNKGMHSRCMPSVKFETSSRTDYEKIKAQVEAKTKYIKTKMYRNSKEHYMDHIYSNDEVVVHMYDIAFGHYCCPPRYVIEIYSIYSGH